MAFPNNPIYKLVNDPISGELLNIKRYDGALISLDEMNTDYATYLAWVSEGNVAESAD
tara:strand:+ start:403 stop:576 length:174 start_codon:yes stop_codon:yes gene_type:complete